MATTNSKTSQQTEPTVQHLPSPEKRPACHMDVITSDEHAGKGGSYVIDPATGVRTLSGRTKEAGTNPAAD
jgi:hypothetical protein